MENQETLTNAVVEAEKTVTAEKTKSSSTTTTVQLPSNGLMNPNITHVTLRRMTTMEFKTLHTSKDPNYLTNLLLSCIIEPVNVTSKDLHPNDVIYLLFVLRYISTPNKLVERFRCSKCNQFFEANVDIQQLNVKYANTTTNEFTTTLPDSGSKVTFRILSEGDLINAERISDRQIRQNNLEGEEAEWHTLISKFAYQVLTVDDKEFDNFSDKVKFLESLSFYDFESYQKAYNEVIKSFGLDLSFYATCDKCNNDVEVNAYIAPDFFRFI